MLSHVPGLQTYNSKQPFSLVNGVAVQIYRQASKLTTSPGSLRLHIEITCDYITLQIYMRPAKRWGWKSQGSPFERFAWPCVFSSPVFNSLPAERDYGIVSRIAPAYCAILKTLSSFSLNAAISCPILSLVIRA